ncbi:MAG: metal-dependent hydrolase [Dehalococcoidia bacterium]
MLVFGHAGITFGAAILVAGALSATRRPSLFHAGADGHPDVPTEHPPGPGQSPAGGPRWLHSLTSRVDIRVLLIGSLLPDIVDKPVGQYLFSDTISNGRIFSHTVLFAAIIALIGLYLYRSRGSVSLLVLAFGSSVHLILDEMWLAPQTLLWPALGLSFDRVDLADWAMSMLRVLFSEPSVWIPDLIGLAILIWFAAVLARGRGIRRFARYGQVSLMRDDLSHR